MREDDDVQELRRGLVVLEERAKLENEVFENEMSNKKMLTLMGLLSPECRGGPQTGSLI